MKVLIVAHPDDEAIFFAPEQYDRIIIVHLDRPDDPAQGDQRRLALAAHPLRDRITVLGYTESGYWRDGSKLEAHTKNYEALCAFLKTLEADEVTTHDAKGEYGHADHIMAHYACMDTLNCPVNGRDPKVYRAIKQVYKQAGCWTWH